MLSGAVADYGGLATGYASVSRLIERQIRGEEIFTIQNGKLSSLRVFINTK